MAGSRSESREAFEFEDVDTARPAATRRISVTAPRRQGSGNVASTGLNLWSTITFPVRLIVSILSGTWYFLSKSYLSPDTDSSIDFHANFVSPIYASLSPSSLGRSDA